MRTIFKKLQQYCTEREITRKLKKSHQEQGGEFRKVKTVGILVDHQDFDTTAVLEAVNRILDIKNKQVIKLVFKKHQKGVEEKSAVCICKEDFGWNMRLKSERVQDFVANPFDLLVNFSASPNLYLNMLTVWSNAHFKVGFSKIDDRLFDLVISEPNFDIIVFMKELKKYLLILNKMI